MTYVMQSDRATVYGHVIADIKVAFYDKMDIENYIPRIYLQNVMEIGVQNKTCL